MMELDDKFFEELKKWKTHCGDPKVRIQSCGRALECEAFHNLVNMGEDILPFISKLYAIHFALRDEKSYHGSDILVYHGLPMLLSSIVGEKYQIPKEIQGKVEEMREYSYRWLTDYLGFEKAIL